MVPTTVNELANLLIEFGFATDGVTHENIITIIINDVNYPVTAVLPAGTTAITMQSVVDIINNDPDVSPLVIASIEMNATGTEPVLVLRGRSVTAGFITFNNDLTFVGNWGPDNVVQDINGTTVDITNGAVPGQAIEMLEPKPANPAFDEVYIPYHTEVVSDDPTLSINYWANLKYDTLDNANSVVTSVVSAKHPETNEDIVYIAYINYADVVIEARYANGANSGQLVTGLTNNKVGFQPMPNGWVDSYWTAPRVLSATLVYDSVTGRLFLKSIVSGAIYAESSYAAVNTSVLSVCELDPSLSETVQWVRTIAHDPLQNVPQAGFGVFQRSDGGFVIDNDHNLIVACNVLIPLTDSYYGTQSWAPGVEISKMMPNGSLVWSQIIETGQYYDPILDENYQIPEGGYVQQSDRFFIMPANVAVGGDNSIYVSHGTCFHKLDSDGGTIWTKEFDQLSLGNVASIARLVTDIQVHPTTHDVYVAVSGFPTLSESVTAIFKFPDTSIGESTEATGAVWLSPTFDATSEPWGGASQYCLYVPVSMKLDTNLNQLVVAAALQHHGFDGYTSVPAGQMSVIAINVTNMSIAWSTDTSIAAVSGYTDVELFPLIASTWFDRQNVGYSAFDFIRDGAGLATSVCYGAPLYIGEGAQGNISPAGLVVAQTIVSSTVADNLTDAAAAVRYKFESHTAYDVSANTSFSVQMANNPVIAYNGVPMIANEVTYSTWTRFDTATTLNNTLYTQYNDFTWILPPASSYNKTSMYVKNIAEIGELIINGEIPAPTSLVGTALDRAGSFRPSADGLFYCTADYDGSTPVWKKLPFGATGGRIKLDPIGYNNNMGTIAGCPTDQVGDIFVMDNVVLVCTDPYDGTNNIWNPVLPTYGTGMVVSTNRFTTYDSSRPDLWPHNYYLNGYTVTISAGGAQPADLTGGCVGKPPANAQIMSFVAPRNIRVNSTNAGSLWRCMVAPSANRTFIVKKNGSYLGEIMFWSGSNLGQLWSSWDVLLYVGDILTVHAPSTQDTTLSDVYFTIYGTTF